MSFLSLLNIHPRAQLCPGEAHACATVVGEGGERHTALTEEGACSEAPALRRLAKNFLPGMPGKGNGMD